ncbi:MAG: radical SAM protein [Pirellulales bacterium]|nr:radical SAM protein [Pirellulales bacterium]
MNSTIKNPLHLRDPIKITISYTHTCSCDCKHCYASCTKQRSEKELPADKWLEFIDYLEEIGVISILFEGGEPLNRSDFIPVLTRASRSMMTKLRTNGVLVDRHMARTLEKSGVGTVFVDFMGASNNTHEYFTNVKGSFDAACNAVSHLLSAGVVTNMLMIMTRQNKDEIQDFLNLAYDLGVRKAGVLRLYPIGRAKKKWKEFACSLDEMTSALHKIKVPEGLYFMQSWHPKDGNCCWQMAAVNAFGDSIGCTYLREFVNYGNISRHPFLETWEHPLYRELRAGHVQKACSDCSATQGSVGGCRSTAYAFTGKWDAPDPFDIALNEGVDLRDLPEWNLQEDPRPQGTSD